MKQTIRLNESQFNRLVKETVKKCLNEVSYIESDPSRAEDDFIILRDYYFDENGKDFLIDRLWYFIDDKAGFIKYMKESAQFPDFEDED